MDQQGISARITRNTFFYAFLRVQLIEIVIFTTSKRKQKKNVCWICGAREEEKKVELRNYWIGLHSEHLPGMETRLITETVLGRLITIGITTWLISMFSEPLRLGRQVLWPARSK